MSRTSGADTREKILVTARQRVATDGIGSLTLDAVAEAVGVTKQAVLYHFGSKRGLIVELWVGELEQEVEALTEVLAEPRSAPEVLRSFIAGAVDYYLADLDRFRILYVINQTSRQEAVAEERERREQVYPATARLYDRLEEAIRADADLTTDVDARRLAVGAHFTALGIAAYMGMLDAAGDTLRHDPHRLASELGTLLGRGATRA
jgi:AcrR family transcriptional regulator